MAQSCKDRIASTIHGKDQLVFLDKLSDSLEETRGHQIATWKNWNQWVVLELMVEPRQANLGSVSG